jgi:hypothetical protein
MRTSVDQSSFSRREFVKWAAFASTLTVATRGYAKRLPLLNGLNLLPGDSGHSGLEFGSAMPGQKEVWDWLSWMAKLGPKFTGNQAHQTYTDFLESHMRSSGLEVTLESYTFPRWEARRYEITINPASGQSSKVPVTSYFPYSGQTPAQGVTGELVYVGSDESPNLSGLSGKIALVECPVKARPFAEWYQTWGVYPPNESFPTTTSPARGPLSDLAPFRKAGAVAVILGWTDISDANAADQYTPFSRPPQNIPALYVGRESTARLRALAGNNTRVTVVLEADVIPDSPTRTILATLPGASSDEVIIVNTHTDGTNATEENGGIAILALAKYFSKMPKMSRKRTLVFPLATGHFASPWVPSIRGVIEKHPDLIKKAVAAVAIEHLGCREWMDDSSWNYKATGKNEWSVAISPLKSTADVMLEGLQGSQDRAGVVNPAHGGWFGEGGSLARAGIPTIGYIPQPNYLLAAPANGCIEKLSPELMHSQIEVFARVIRKMDSMSRDQLKGA